MDDTPKRRPGRPRTTGTPPVRTIRIPDQLWHAALAVAAARKESVPDVVRRLLGGYVRRHRGEVSK
jgi:hypothetical protein